MLAFHREERALHYKGTERQVLQAYVRQDKEEGIYAATTQVEGCFSCSSSVEHGQSSISVARFL